MPANFAQYSTVSAAAFASKAATNVTSFGTAAGPALPVDGDATMDTNRNSLVYIMGSTLTNTNSLYSIYANVAVANTVTETDIINTASSIDSKTLVADFLTQGKVICIKAMGFYSTTVNNPTLRFRVRIGGIAGTVVLDSTAVAGGVSTSNRGWKLEGLINVRTTGATGTVFAQGQVVTFQTATAVTNQDLVNTATQTIDTTVSQAIVLSVEWQTADAGNTITCTVCTIESVS